MKGHQITFGEYQGHAVAVLVSDGILQDLFIDSSAPRPGTIYRGKATRQVKGQGGMFFATPDGDAFLRGAKGYAPGDTTLLQVTGYAEPGKAVPVTDRILCKSRYAIATAGAPGINISRSIRDENVRVALQATAESVTDDLRGCGLILRSSSANADLGDVADDIERVLNTVFVVISDDGTGPEKLIEGPEVAELAWCEWPDVVGVQDSIADYLEEALQPENALAGGAQTIVEPTRAFIAVDVNTGTDISHAAGLKANIATARDLPRLLRLKGLGGQIVIDFAPMPKKERHRVEQTLNAAFRADPVQTTSLGWTNLGHFEMTRKRARAPLHEVIG